MRKISSEGAEAILLACTDLRIIIGKEDAEVPVLDTTSILEKAVIKRAG